ncbi:MAG: gliding motility-associated C-terminal domain-containing protein [Saprospiraceae bacterium]
MTDPTGVCQIMGSDVPTRTGDLVNCEGVYTYTWEFTDQCNRTVTHTQNITILPPPAATFINPPADVTVSCLNAPDPNALPPLDYTNGVTDPTGACQIMGSDVPTRTGDLVNCEGVYTYTWEVTDQCNRTITHTQNITILPPPAATFINPPADVTVSCLNAPDPNALPPLDYTNGVTDPTGVCQIMGNDIPTRTGDLVNCAGVYTYTWEVTDQCNRTITHTQNITILPPAPATFINPPTDITVLCTDAPDLSVPPTLSYENGETGSCIISGNVPAVINGGINGCQGVYNLVWEYTDYCNRTIQWTQRITVLPPVDASFVNPPPALVNVSCENEPDPNNLPVLNVSNNSSGSCLISGTSTPTLNVVENNCAKTYTYTWQYTDFCDRTITYTQVVNVAPPPVATLTDAPTYTSLSCSDADAFSAPDINYSNNSTCLISGVLTPVVNKNFNECGGNIQISWTGVDACNRPLSYNQIIVVNPAPNPTITTPIPDDITVDCQDLSVFAIPLEFSNGEVRPCAREGIIPPVLNTSGVTLCGGTATVNWTLKDACNFTLTADQIITVLPAPQAAFINVPPASIQISCEDVPPVPPTLDYTNGETGFCGINGTVTPITTGGFTACGGTIQYTWQYTDMCGRSIVYNQNVTVRPADEPVFTSDPVDELLPCNQGFSPPPTLNYTNGLSGACAITGTVSATVEDLGSTRIYTWTYKNPCTNNEITVDQEVSIRPVPNIVADPVNIDICYGEFYDLADINVTDLNNTNITLTYHSGTPASAANEIPQTLISTEAISVYYILATNEYGCTDEVKITFKNLFGPQAGIGNDVTICNDGRTLNLWNYLTPPYNNTGYWSDTYGTGLDISDPTAVSFLGQVAGNYPFDYIVPSTNLCPDAVATVQITLVDPGTYEIKEIACSADFMTYSVKIQVFGYSVTSSHGTINTNGSLWTISNIPITQNVTITLKSNLGDCADAQLTLTPPQCNCPVVPSPISGGNKFACQNQTGVNLSVTVSAGLSAQWYDALSGGNLLMDQSLTFAPPTVATGVTTYYVQAIDPLNGCYSVRIPILFTVQPNPVATDVVLETCDDNRDGIAQFTLTNANSKLITGGGFSFSYYLTLADAQNTTNPLPSNYTNLSNNQVVYALVVNANGCKDIAEVTLHVLPQPDVTFSVTDEVCFGAHNGVIFVNPPYANLEFKLNNLPWTSNGVFDSLAPATYTVLVRDTFGCFSTYSHTIDPGQRLTFTEFTLTCDSKGTTSNANDDVYNIKINVGSTPASSGNYTVTYLGKNLGSFTYNSVHNISIPADGTSGLIVIKDSATGCEISRNIGPLTPCSTDCEISVNNLTVTCDNKGTDADATDDIYTISFTANVVNGGNSSSFTLLINNVIINTYAYGTPVSFTLPANGTTPDVKIRDLLNIQCITDIPVGLLSGCSGSCSISAMVSNITCNDNGTINDPNDDTFTFTIRVTGFNLSDGWRLGSNSTIYSYNTNVVLGPYPISGGNLNLTIADRVDALCTKTVNVTAPAPCSTPCVLQVNNVNIGPCDNNNTGNTAADDKFNITFVVNVVSGSTNFYNVTVGAQSYGPFTYGQTASINGLIANNQNITLTVTDAINSGCTVQFVVKKSPCSSCPQTVSAGPDIQLTCLQNTATLTGTASVSGGIFVWTGPNNFNKTGETVTTSGEGTYTLTVTFPDQCVATDMVVVTKDANLPIANAGPDQELTCNKTSTTLTGSSNLTANVLYTWTNAAGTVIGNTPTITVNSVGFYYLEVTNSLNNCKSGKDEVEVFNRNQQLTFNVKSWVCDNNGTTSDGSDDTYTITFNMSNSTNATNKYSITYLGNEIGQYNYNENVTIVVPADGNLRFYEFIDLVTGCKTNINAGPFTSCSTNCLISFTDPVSDCDNKDTESIETDDTYTITFSASGVNASGSFTVTVDGQAKGTYTYGSVVQLTFPADGHTPFVVLTDLNISACQVVVPMPALKPCSSTCAITAEVSNVLCNDNGTINDPSDDVYYFDVIVQGLNTSTGWKVSGNNTVHPYNERVNFGPYPISAGATSLTVVDNTSANCTASVSVNPPSVCSEPCVIAMANLEILGCNNNNTNTIVTDDYFSIRFRINRLSGSATNYTVTDGVTTYGPFIYGELVTIDNLKADGTDIKLLVTDPSNSGCKTEFIVKKAPCSSCTVTADAGSNQLITCQQNVVTLTGTATPGGTFNWSGPGNFNKTGASVTTSWPGTYILSVVYPDLCVAIDSVVVGKDANVPEAFGGPDRILNCLIAQVEISGSTNQTGNVNLIWTDANGNQVGNGTSISVTTPGTYFFEVINTTNNCSSGKDEVVVTEDKKLPEATIVAEPGNLLDCIIGTIVLSGKPVANVIFNWQTGESFFSNRPSITVSSEGIVTMTAIDTTNGCRNIATIEIIDLQDYPILKTTPPGPITCVNNGVYISAADSPEGPNLVFSWMDGTNTIISGETNDSLYVTSPGTYYVILTDTLNGCSNRDTFVVDRIGEFPQVKVPDDITLFCGQNTTKLTASVINPTASTSLVWNTVSGTIVSPSNQSSIDVRGAGVYEVKVVYPNSGCTTTESVNVFVNSNYPTDLTSLVNDETCKNQKDGSITISAVSGGEPPLMYRLNGVNVGPGTTYSPLAAGTYQMEVTDANGCKFSTNIVVEPGVDIDLFATSPIELVYNQTQIIELITNLKPEEIASIKWTPTDNLSCDTCLVTSLIARTNITYKVEIIDINGCSESVTITIRVNDNVIITTPNIINPNGSTNKWFTVFGNESVLNIEKMSVFDRWGNLVFIKENFKPNIPTEGWDGTFLNKDVVPGVYVFLIEYMAPSGVKKITGDITVIR